jgi:hypothetical protein
MPPLSFRRPAIPVALTALLAIAAGCGDPEEEVVIRHGPALTVEPASLTLRAGDSALFGVRAIDRETGTARWAIDSASIAWIDSARRTIPAGGPAAAYVHGVAPGSTVLRLTAALPGVGQTVSGSVPVTVLPRTP